MDIVDLIEKVFQKWGWKGLIPFGIITIIGGTLWKIPSSRKYALRYLRRFVFKRVEQLDLTDHLMFLNLNKFIVNDIKHFKLKNKLREAIFRDFLLIKFMSVKRNFESFISTHDLNSMSSSKFQARLLECMNDITRDYERRALEQGIPEIVISKFNEWNEPKVSAIYEYVGDVCDDNELYPDNFTKMRIILDFIYHINNFTIMDAKKTLTYLNGQLNDVVYKGITNSDI